MVSKGIPASTPSRVPSSQLMDSIHKGELNAIRNIRDSRAPAEPVDTIERRKASGLNRGDGARALAMGAAFKALSPALQEKALTVGAAVGSNYDVANLDGLLQTPGFKALDDTQKGQALDVFGGSNTLGRESLVKLGNRQIDGKPALLDQADNGRTLIHEAHRMATMPLDPAFKQSGIPRRELLGATLQSAATPGSIVQDAKGTCSVTSLQYVMAKRRPAEFASMMTNLSGPEGKHVGGKGALIIRREQGSIPPDDATGRSVSSRIFQATMMEEGNGKALDYDNRTDLNSDGSHGMTTNQLDYAAKALFGVSGKISAEQAGVEGSHVLGQLQRHQQHDAVVGMYWNGNGHWVAVEGIDDKNLYVRDPMGGQKFSEGKTFKGPPPRRLEDAAKGVYSIPLMDAQKALVAAVIIPD